MKYGLLVTRKMKFEIFSKTGLQSRDMKADDNKTENET